MILLLAEAVWMPMFNSPINPASTIMTMVFVPFYYCAWLAWRHLEC